MVKMSASCCGILQDKKNLILSQRLTTEVQDAAAKFMLLTLRLFVTGAQACVLAFSTVDRNSFEAIESWKHKVNMQPPVWCVRVCKQLVFSMYTFLLHF